MPENNNNNDNLFTQMFGLESEQPTSLPPKQEEPKKEEKKEDNIQPVSEVKEKVISSDTSEKPTSILPESRFQSGFDSQLNQLPSLTPVEQLEQDTPIFSDEPITISTTPKKEEVINLTPGIVISPKTEKTEKFDPNSINNIPNEYKSSEDFSYEDLNPENTTASKFIFKILLIFIGIIALIGGWLLFYNTILGPINDKDLLTSTTDTEKNPNQETEEQEETEEKKIIPFDQTLSFYKGLVDDPNELNQTLPYTPKEKTGVIMCDLINTLETTDAEELYNVYLYYEEHLLKKVYQEDILIIKDKEMYNSSAALHKIIDQSFEDTETLTIDMKYDQTNQKITIGMFSNLAYGSYGNVNSELNFKLDAEYNEDIKKTMERVFGSETLFGNIKCSSVKTT